MCDDPALVIQKCCALMLTPKPNDSGDRLTEQNIRKCVRAGPLCNVTCLDTQGGQTPLEGRTEALVKDIDAFEFSREVRLRNTSYA